MGQAKSLLAKIAPLGEEEVRQLAALYGFERHEMEALHRYFTVIAGSVEDVGVIDMNEFQAALGFQNSAFATMLFHALDEDESTVLEFDEFVRGFYLLSPMAKRDEKIKFTFKIYDVDGNGEVDNQEMYQLLSDIIRADTSRNIHFTDQMLKDWVAASIRSMTADQNDNKITLEDYSRMIDRHPQILEALTIPMNFLRSGDVDQKFEKSFLRKSMANLRKTDKSTSFTVKPVVTKSKSSEKLTLEIKGNTLSKSSEKIEKKKDFLMKSSAPMNIPKK